MQKSPLEADFLCSAELAEPPNFAIKDETNEVYDPKEGCIAENKNNSNNDAENIICINTFDDAIYSPENSSNGQTKKNLHKQRKIINGFNEIFHYKPPKNIFSGKRAFTCYIIHHK